MGAENKTVIMRWKNGGKKRNERRDWW